MKGNPQAEFGQPLITDRDEMVGKCMTIEEFLRDLSNGVEWRLARTDTVFKVPPVKHYVTKA